MGTFILRIAVRSLDNQDLEEPDRRTFAVETDRDVLDPTSQAILDRFTEVLAPVDGFLDVVLPAADASASPFEYTITRRAGVPAVWYLVAQPADTVKLLSSVPSSPVLPARPSGYVSSVGGLSGEVDAEDLAQVLQPYLETPSGETPALVFTFSNASTWTMIHNRNTMPDVVLVSDAYPGERIFTDVTYPDLNTTVATWPSGESGKAYIP